MNEDMNYAVVRQLAKLQYWATRALDFDHAMSLKRAQMAVREFADDLNVPHAGLGWWEQIAHELEHLNAEVSATEKAN